MNFSILTPKKFVSRVLGARLACVRHTASVNPELGSNSSNKKFDLNRSEERFIKFKKCSISLKIRLCKIQLFSTTP